MSVDRSAIGKWVCLEYSDGSPYAEGRVITYCGAATVGIITATGERIDWRADMAHISHEGPTPLPNPVDAHD